MRNLIRPGYALLAAAALCLVLADAATVNAATTNPTDDTLTSLRGKVTKLAAVSRSGITLSGTFELYTPLDLRLVTITIYQLLDEEGGAGELLDGDFPLVLTATPGNKTRNGRYTTPTGVKPKLRLEIPTDRTEPGSFFLNGSLATTALPQLCPPGRGSTTALKTGFFIDDGINPIVMVEGTTEWQCLGRDATTPTSLLAP